MNCPKCNQSVLPNTRFCGSCGQIIDSGAAAATSAATTASPSPTRAILQRIQNIVLTPKTEWPVIAPEATSIAQLYTGYVMPLAAFAALMTFVHMSLIGLSVPFSGTIRTPITSGLVYTVVAFGFGLLGVFLLGLIINGLMFWLAGNFVGGFHVAGFLPAFLGSIVMSLVGGAIDFLLNQFMGGSDQKSK